MISKPDIHQPEADHSEAGQPAGDAAANPGNNPNVGPAPVEARPNHVGEKTYRAPDAPEGYRREIERMPEKTAVDAVERDMGAAVEAVKDKL